MRVWEKFLNRLRNVTGIGIYNGKYFLVYVDHFIYVLKRTISYIILYFFFPVILFLLQVARRKRRGRRAEKWSEVG